MLPNLIRHIRIFRSELFDVKTVRQQVPACPRWRWAAARYYLSHPEIWGIDTHALFSGEFYLARNPDVKTAGIAPLSHYLVRGDAEQRDPHPLFSVRHYRVDQGYRQRRPSSLEHYLRRGAQSDATPCRGFDPELYRNPRWAKGPHSHLLIDVATTPSSRESRAFIACEVERALQKCSRSAAQGSLPDFPSATDARGIATGLCDVVIPVKNAIDWLDRCITWLLQCADAKSIGAIILVDDSCSPESRHFLDEIVSRDHRILPVRNQAAPGFAAACNTGFRHATADHVLFLNSDCLLSDNTITKMLRAFAGPSRVGLACAPANNAANVTLPLLDGETFVSMNQLVEQVALAANGASYVDICTTVGHCLMVSRECYQVVGGMDESWGLGYGEESDLHLRARAHGFLGVLVTDAYVYHFGGGTFRHEKTCEDLRRKNYARFVELWGDAFDLYSRFTEVENPIRPLTKQLELVKNESRRDCDVLFVLPCLIRGIGGVHVVLDLCNHLITRGMDARVVVVGPMDEDALAEYSEPLYFSPYHAKDVEEFLTAVTFKPTVVVTTLYSTVPSAWKFAQRCGARLINFVQGFEPYFDSGRPYEQVRNTYFLAQTSITTSSWLTEKVKSKALGCDVKQLPLGINKYTFYPPHLRQFRGAAKLRIGLVLRASVDKGQFILRELIDLLFSRGSDFSLTVFKPDDYPLAPPDSQVSDFKLVRLPASRSVIADALREVDIFVDASLHEGYGLFPLEAMGCGACAVVSDSGGISQYLQDGENGRIVLAMNKPEAYLEQLLELHRDRDALLRMREAAVQTAQSYDEEACFDRYEEFFRGLLEHSSHESFGSEGADKHHQSEPHKIAS